MCIVLMDFASVIVNFRVVKLLFVVFSCQSLQSGEYSNGTACVPCPVGFYCPSPLAAPQACTQGTYQTSTGQTSCLSCPSGQSCINRSATPVDCSAGYFSQTGDGNCQVGYSCFHS